MLTQTWPLPVGVAAVVAGAVGLGLGFLKILSGFFALGVAVAAGVGVATGLGLGLALLLLRGVRVGLASAEAVGLTEASGVAFFRDFFAGLTDAVGLGVGVTSAASRTGSAIKVANKMKGRNKRIVPL